MSNIHLQKDLWKVNIKRNIGIALMLIAGLILTFFIISSIWWMANYNILEVRDILDNPKINSKKDADAYVRFRTMMAIISNTLILGTFSGFAWWGMSKKRFGYGFGLVWIIVFAGNAISLPFYTLSRNWVSIASSILHIFIIILLVYWIALLMQHRTHLKISLANRKIKK